MRTSYIQIDPSDNVAVAINKLMPGDKIHVNNKKIKIKETILPGHKVALQNLLSGDLIIKYGYPIGHLTENRYPGSLINESNIKTNLSGILNYQYTPQLTHKIHRLPIPRSFQGFERKNGDVGIRNEIWIIPTVGCVNGVVNQLAKKLQNETQSENIDAIVAYPHNYGCSQLGDDHENTRKILRNIALHPNAGGVLIVGLGCENNQLHSFRNYLGDYDTQRIRFMECQQAEDEIETGIEILRELYTIVSKDKRTIVPANKLRLGLKCGGSDGFSGITANPLLGILSDSLIGEGGTTVLTEVPEMFGAESILMNRCATKQVFEKTVNLINRFKDYFIVNHQPIYENPSPGNKAGGISTLEEKSLGCTQKSGHSAVQDVLKYGDRIKTDGLNLLSAPGNDLVASTALAAAGCQMILFTTGRGTPFGTLVPTVKISTNTRLSEFKPRWIDFNAGSILEEEDMDTACQRLIRYIFDVASGTPVNNEIKDYREIAILKTGVTL